VYQPKPMPCPEAIGSLAWKPGFSKAVMDWLKRVVGCDVISARVVIPRLLQPITGGVIVATRLGSPVRCYRKLAASFRPR
jgi:hypothetical protein